MSVPSGTQLALETIGKSASLAVLIERDCVRSITLNADDKVRPAAALAPMLDEILSWARANTDGLDFLSVAIGPGSFTGLRVGVTTAKMLAYALDLPVVAVDSLAGYAASCWASPIDRAQSDRDFSRVESENRSVGAEEAGAKLLVGLNAYRKQVFAAEFARDDLFREDGLANPALAASQILEQDAWIDRLSGTTEQANLAGDESVFRVAPPSVDIAARFVRPKVCIAHGIGLIGLTSARRGAFTDAMALLPNYLKASAAEEKAT